MIHQNASKLTAEEIADCFCGEAAKTFPPILTLDQAAQLLQTSTATIHRWKTRGLLESCVNHQGCSIRFLRDRLVRWYFDGAANQDDDHRRQDCKPRPEYQLRKRRERWYVWLQINNRRLRRSLKTSDELLAQELAPKLVASLKNEATPTQTDPTLTIVSDEYVKHVQAEQLAPRTIAKYRWMIKKILQLAAPMHIRVLTDVTPAFLDTYRLKRQKDGASPKTIFNETISFKQLLNFAVGRRWIERSPLKDVKVRKPKPRPQPFWTTEQLRLILSAAERSPYHDVFLLLAETGMRIGEVKNLTWDDVDLERRVLLIREKSIGSRADDVWRPKTGDQRVVPMSDEVAELLKRQVRHDKWVFHRPKRVWPKSKWRQINDRSVLGNLKRILKKLALPGHVHTFRHSFISHALMKGVPEAMVRHWVGHVDPATIRHYTHIADSQSQAHMKALFDLVTVADVCK